MVTYYSVSESGTLRRGDKPTKDPRFRSITKKEYQQISEQRRAKAARVERRMLREPKKVKQFTKAEKVALREKYDVAPETKVVRVSPTAFKQVKKAQAQQRQVDVTKTGEIRISTQTRPEIEREQQKAIVTELERKRDVTYKPAKLSLTPAERVQLGALERLGYTTKEEAIVGKEGKVIGVRSGLFGQDIYFPEGREAEGERLYRKSIRKTYTELERGTLTRAKQEEARAFFAPGKPSEKEFPKTVAVVARDIFGAPIMDVERAKKTPVISFKPEVVDIMPLSEGQKREVIAQQRRELATELQTERKAFGIAARLEFEQRVPIKALGEVVQKAAERVRGGQQTIRQNLGEGVFFGKPVRQSLERVQTEWILERGKSTPRQVYFPTTKKEFKESAYLSKRFGVLAGVGVAKGAFGFVETAGALLASPVQTIKGIPSGLIKYPGTILKRFQRDPISAVTQTGFEWWAYGKISKPITTKLTKLLPKKVTPVKGASVAITKHRVKVVTKVKVPVYGKKMGIRYLKGYIPAKQVFKPVRTVAAIKAIKGKPRWVYPWQKMPKPQKFLKIRSKGAIRVGEVDGRILLQQYKYQAILQLKKGKPVLTKETVSLPKPPKGLKQQIPGYNVPLQMRGFRITRLPKIGYKTIRVKGVSKLVKETGIIKRGVRVKAHKRLDIRKSDLIIREIPTAGQIGRIFTKKAKIEYRWEVPMYRKGKLVVGAYYPKTGKIVVKPLHTIRAEGFKGLGKTVRHEVGHKVDIEILKGKFWEKPPVYKELFGASYFDKKGIVRFKGGKFKVSKVIKFYKGHGYKGGEIYGEFRADLVRKFFSKPKMFKAKLPVTYKALKTTLGEPLAKTKVYPYVTAKTVKVPAHIRKIQYPFETRLFKTPKIKGGKPITTDIIPGEFYKVTRPKGIKGVKVPKPKKPLRVYDLNKAWEAALKRQALKKRLAKTFAFRGKRAQLQLFKEAMRPTPGSLTQIGTIAGTMPLISLDVFAPRITAPLAGVLAGVAIKPTTEISQLPGYRIRPQPTPTIQVETPVLDRQTILGFTPKIGIETPTKEDEFVIVDSGTRQRRKAGTRVRTQPAVQQDVVQIQVPRMTPFRPIIAVPFEPPGITVPLRTDLPEKEKRKEERLVRRGTYNAMVKERGKFVRVNEQPLSYKDAMGLGATVVDESASATFKVGQRSRRGTPKKSNFRIKQFEQLANKFYKKQNKHIEKNKYRIDTLGELRGITAEGWKAQRRKASTKQAKKQLRGLIGGM